MGATWSQFFPTTPPLTETNLPSQRGKVFIVTGGASGVGLELCSILYRAGAKVYLAGRSGSNVNAAITKIKSATSAAPAELGEMAFLSISLDDLNTIKPAVDSFRAAESRLDGLFNNAGVSNPPKGSVSPQHHELQMATNCLGPYLLTQLLLPILVSTASTVDIASTRVIWTSSIVTDVSSPKGGIPLESLVTPSADQQLNYALSKTGNWFLADALAKQAGREGILSVTINPGNLSTGIVRHLPSWVTYLVAPLLYKAKYGAYTNLWAAFSPDLTIEDGGRYVVPWGRLHPSPRQDIVEAMKTKEDGGTGEAAAFVEYCDRRTAGFFV